MNFPEDMIKNNNHKEMWRTEPENGKMRTKEKTKLTDFRILGVYTPGLSDTLHLSVEQIRVLSGELLFLPPPYLCHPLVCIVALN